MFSIEYLHSDSQLRRAVEAFISDWNSENTTVEVRTSGSTGQPKALHLQKMHMRQSARKTAAFLGLKEGHTALLCLSPETIAGKMMIVRAIECGLHLLVGKVNAHPLEHVTNHVDFAAMVPLQVESSLVLHRQKLEQIGCLIIGGAPLSMQLNDTLAELGGKIYHTFGMTETISHIAMRAVSSAEHTYFPLPGVSLSQKDGLLVIHAPDLGVEHLQTHDEVELRDGGFQWLGRRDFVINSGGIKLHPEAIEAQLAARINRPFFVAGLPDARLGTALILCIEGEAFDPKSLEMDTFLERYAIPKQCFFLSQFVYTPSGKVNRLETLKLLGNGSE